MFARCTGSSKTVVSLPGILPCIKCLGLAAHCEIWKYGQSTSRVQASVLQNLRVQQGDGRERGKIHHPARLHKGSASSSASLLTSTASQAREVSFSESETVTHQDCLWAQRRPHQSGWDPCSHLHEIHGHGRVISASPSANLVLPGMIHSVSWKACPPVGAGSGS